MNELLGDRWLSFVYCFLLFSAGGVFGFIFTPGGKVGFVTFLSAMASVATVAAAFAALKALTLWKSQFQLQKKYDSIVEARTFLFDATRPLIYLESLTRLFEEYLRSLDESSLTKNYPTAELEVWHSHATSFGRSWDMMMVLLTEDEFKIFSSSPQEINNIVISARESLVEIAFRSDPDSYVGSRGQLIVALRPKYNEYARALSQAYKDLEEQSKLLLKILTK